MEASAATGRRLALSVASASAPSDVYVFEPDTQELTRWTQSELGMLDPTRLVLPSVLRFPTWDRVEGQQRVLRAYGYQAAAAASAPRPVLILLRSGDGTQFRPGYDPFLQYLVNELRFVVVAPNLRGASGYGSSTRPTRPSASSTAVALAASGLSSGAVEEDGAAAGVADGWTGGG